MIQFLDLLATGVTDDNGNPLSLGTVTFYEGGTSTLQTAYQNYSLATPHTNPATLDAGGRMTAYVDGRVKLLIKNAAGTTIRTLDQVGIEDADIDDSLSDTIAGDGLESAPDGTINTNLDGDYLEVNVDNEITPVAAVQTKLLKAGLDQPYEITNLSLTCSVSASALTLTPKTKAGTDPSATDPIYMGVRHATATNGTYLQRSIVAAPTALVVPSTATLGTMSGKNSYLYFGFVDNAGTLEPCISHVYTDPGTIVSTTAISTSADVNNVIYSTTARSNVPVRFTHRLKTNQTTAGTWAAVPTEVAHWPFEVQKVVAIYDTNTAQAIVDSTDQQIDYEDRVIDTHGAVTTGASWAFTAPKAGVYEVAASVNVESTLDAAEFLSFRLFKNGSGHRYFARHVAVAAFTEILTLNGTAVVSLAAGDTVSARITHNAGGNRATSATNEFNHIAIREVTYT